MKKTKATGEDSSSSSSIKINRSRGSGKKRPDLFARLRNDEHPLDTILPDLPLEPPKSEPIQPILPNDSPSNPVEPQPTAPVKDFQRVPNSITRDAVPNKFFKGTSKSTYDALYLKTRGAINPIRVVRATKRELMKWIGISHVTIFKHLKHLESVGLLKIEQQLGSHSGSFYEVFIPEEVEPIPSHTNPSHPILTHPIPSYPILYNKVVWDPYNKVVWDRMGNRIENKGLSNAPNTSLNTSTNDDDKAFADFIGIFEQGSRKLTGKGIQKRDADKWRSLAELLMLELEVAARRTESVSNVPAFLTEHLRRKLLSGSAHNPAKKQKSQPDVVGKPNESGEYEIKPLDKASREAALDQLREFAGDELLQDFKKWYTEEDWAWLIKELESK